MKSRFFILFGLLIISSASSFGQLTPISNNVFPIGDNHSISWKSSMVKSESIIFEANPVITYSIFNNIYKKLKSDRDTAIAIYFLYRPQLRMYTDRSLPVKMPSYKILTGFQCVLRDRIFNEDNLFAIAIESGHYSNGQGGCAFSTLYRDGTRESDSVIAAITPKTNLSAILNRVDGEFSTNLTEFVVNYRFNSDFRYNIANQTISIKYGLTYYHKFMLGFIPMGGYANNLIGIYGHRRHKFGIEYIKVRGNNKISIAENLEYIRGAHPFVNPIRIETIFSYFFHGEAGVFISYVYGHDNYNSRFVDSGHQVSIGFTWSIFPPFETKSMKDKEYLN